MPCWLVVTIELQDQQAVQAALQQGIVSTMALLQEPDVSKVTGEYRRRILL